MTNIYEHRFGENVDIEEKGCLRCSNYAGYGFYKIRDLPNNKVQYGLRVLCKVSECQPNLKPLTCNFCSLDLMKSLQEVDDTELQDRLKELGMCKCCYEDWQEECYCLYCHFDYPSSTKIKGRKGYYCFCSVCEWNEKCPMKKRSFSNCIEMNEISKRKAEEIMEVV